VLRRRVKTVPLASVGVVALPAAVAGIWLGARVVSRPQNSVGSISSARPVAANGAPQSSKLTAVPPTPTAPQTLATLPVPSVSPSAPSSTRALSDQCKPSDIDVHFSASKGSYAQGETVLLYLWAVNHSARDCEMPYDSCADGVTITDDATGATAWEENPPASGQKCYSKPILLPAGATSGKAGISWTGSAPPGSYQARARWLIDLLTSFNIA
jgi:hypothetical protein